MIVPDITDPAYPPIIRGIEDGLARNGYVAILANTDGRCAAPARIVETMRARAVDGLILATVARERAGAWRGSPRLPVVTVGARERRSERFSSVVHNEEDGIGRMLDASGLLGHRAHRGDRRPAGALDRLRRYRAFMLHRKLLGIGKAKPNAVFANAFNETEGERCAEELLARRPPVHRVVCANDRLAVGAIAALRRHGLRCPEDMSVTGYNDMPLADRLSAGAHHRPGAAPQGRA